MLRNLWKRYTAPTPIPWQRIILVLKAIVGIIVANNMLEDNTIQPSEIACIAGVVLLELSNFNTAK